MLCPIIFLVIHAQHNRHILVLGRGRDNNFLHRAANMLAGVGTLIYRGTEHRVANGDVGPHTRAMRAQLVAIQQGEEPDRHGWLERV